MKRLFATAAVASALVSAPAMAGPTVYGSAAAFTAATTGVTTVDFEGTTTAVNLFTSGNNVKPGFTITQSTSNAFLADPTYTPYYYSWGTGDVISTPHNGVLTVTFASAVTAFALDLGSYYDDNDFSTPCCAASTFYGKDVTIGTSQGNFVVDLNSTRTMKFFGVTSDTAFTSFTVTGVTIDPFASTVLDNIRYGSALTAAVPEPGTWALMILGFGLVGASMRRRAAQPGVRFAF